MAKSSSKTSTSKTSSSSSSLSSGLKSGLSSAGGKLANLAVNMAGAALDIEAIEAANAKGQTADKTYTAFENAAQSQAQALYSQQFAGNKRLVKAALIPRTGESAPTIQFMFNPTDLQFSRSVSITDVDGARTFRGLPKVNFGFIEPYKLQLSGLVFDTYETGEDVYKIIKPLRDSVDFSSFKDPFAKQTITDEKGNTYTYQERTQASTTTNALAQTGTGGFVSALGSMAGVNSSFNLAASQEYGANLETQALELRRPPVFYFIWGENNYMRCMIESLSFKLTMFLPNGRPVRAMVDLTLKEVDLGVASHALSPRKPIVTLSK